MKFLFEVGEVEYKGQKMEALIKYSYGDEGFRAYGEIFNPKRKAPAMVGHIINEIAELFPGDEMVAKIAKVWKDSQEEEFQAGSPRQEDFIDKKDLCRFFPDEIKSQLESVGLNPDPDYIHKGQPYEYGSAWLPKQMSPSAMREIESWANQDSRISSI